MKTFKSSHRMLQSLNTEEKCREYLEELRWHGEPICPHCGSISKHHYKLTQSVKVCISARIAVKDLQLQ